MAMTPLEARSAASPCLLELANPQKLAVWGEHHPWSPPTAIPPPGLRLHHLAGGDPAGPADLRRGRAAQRALPLRLRPQPVRASRGVARVPVSPRGGGPWDRVCRADRPAPSSCPQAQPRRGPCAGSVGAAARGGARGRGCPRPPLLVWPHLQGHLHQLRLHRHQGEGPSLVLVRLGTGLGTGPSACPLGSAGGSGSAAPTL